MKQRKEMTDEKWQGEGEGRCIKKVEVYRINSEGCRTSSPLSLCYIRDFGSPFTLSHVMSNDYWIIIMNLNLALKCKPEKSNKKIWVRLCYNLLFVYDSYVIRACAFPPSDISGLRRSILA